jgi:hypothetical protein
MGISDAAGNCKSCADPEGYTAPYEDPRFFRKNAGFCMSHGDSRERASPPNQ